MLRLINCGGFIKLVLGTIYTSVVFVFVSDGNHVITAIDNVVFEFDISGGVQFVLFVIFPNQLELTDGPEVRKGEVEEEKFECFVIKVQIIVGHVILGFRVILGLFFLDLVMFGDFLLTKTDLVDSIKVIDLGRVYHVVLRVQYRHQGLRVDQFVNIDVIEVDLLVHTEEFKVVIGESVHN